MRKSTRGVSVARCKPAHDEERSLNHPQASTARSFVETDSAAWISQLLGAVQRRDGARIAGLCRQMREPLRLLGGHAVLDRLKLLEASSFSYGTCHTFLLSRALMRDLIALVNDLAVTAPARRAPAPH
jgi:hypothetical protein